MIPYIGDRVRLLPSTRTPSFLHGEDLIVVALSERRMYATVHLADYKGAGRWAVPVKDLSPADTDGSK